MKTSPKRPEGHVETWPLPDYNAFVALMLGTFAKQAAGMNEVQAAHAMARELGLEGGELHWLCDDLLAGVHHIYFVRSSDLYANAADFLKWAEARDLEIIGPENVAWARVLAGADADH